VTIAIGILATDGVVIAADTQTGIPDYLKVGQGKVSITVSRADQAPMGHRSFAISGAGSAGYLKALHERMSHRTSESDVNFLAFGSLEETVSDSLKKFYRHHVVPFSCYPPNERPDFWLIMGAQQGPFRFLWETEKNTLIQRRDFATVGAGAMYARILLSRIYSHDMDYKTAALLAAYAVFHVKEHVDGCGHDTDIAILTEGLPQFLDRPRVRELEDVFREYEATETNALRYALGHGHTSDLIALVDKIRKRASGIIEAGLQYPQLPTDDQ
jgi:hypothetical protein